MLAVTTAGVVGGCASKPAEPEDIGVVRLELTAIPADVNCLRLTATGARTVVQQFDVTPGTNSSLLVTGLPTGLVTITADAFAATCATAGDRTTANWVSEPQTLEVSSSDIADLSLVMHKNGKVQIGVDFKPDVQPTCTDGIQNGAETGVDCGGGTCPKCGVGMSCRTNADCPPGQSCAGLPAGQTHPPARTASRTVTRPAWIVVGPPARSVGAAELSHRRRLPARLRVWRRYLPEQPPQLHRRHPER